MSENLGRLFIPTSTSQKCVNCGFNNERSDSTSYEWQVSSIDTKRHYSQPDVRSNAVRSSSCGSTVRRHIPRGRTQDLVKLFDRMAKDAGGGTTSLRAKSLPPSKQRIELNRIRSVQRRTDSSIQIGVSKSESETQFGSREPLTNKLSLPTTQDVVNENLMNSSQHPIVSSERNNSSDTHALSFHGLNLANQQLTGEIEIDAVDEDEVISNDSTDGRRRTSTPLERHDKGDLSNAFGHFPSIDSSKISAVLDGKCAESEFNGSTNFSEHSSRIHIHNGKGENRTLDEPDSYCEQPAALRVAPPSQRLSLLDQNSTQSGSSQHRQSPDGPQCCSSLYFDGLSYATEHYFSVSQHQSTTSCQESYSTPHYNEIAQEKVDDQIDRIFEFIEQHDELGTTGCETLPERKISVLKDCDAEAVRDDGVSHLPEFLLKTSQASMSCSIHPPRKPCFDRPLKHSISHSRDVQHISRASVDHPVPFSSSAAPPPAGVDVHTHKSREETIGKKVNIFHYLAGPTSTRPCSLAISAPLDSLLGTTCFQVASAVPNVYDSFSSSLAPITSRPETHVTAEEYKRKIEKLKGGIDAQEKRIKMTLKVLALARKRQNLKAQVTAERTLLLACERLDSLRCEMNLVSALSAFRIPPRLVSQELRGTMTISNITVHLSRRVLEPDYDSSYAFLILLKRGAEVQATAPISLFGHDQLRVRQLTFAEQIQFFNLPVDFNVVVEVCAMELSITKKSEQSCAANIANNCLNLLNSVSRCSKHVSRRNDTNLSRFARCGYVILNRDTTVAKKLYLDDAVYPLEGTIEVYARCTTLPQTIEVENKDYLTVYETRSASWKRYWAVLRHGMIYLWGCRSDESFKKRPAAFMDLSKCTNDLVVACNPGQCVIENSFTIDMLVSTTPSIMKKKSVLLRADSTELLEAWLRVLNETLSVLRGEQ